MELQLNNLINNTKMITYINSRDTVIDIKKIISSSFNNKEITTSNIRLYYIDPSTNQINYMLSPYRTILSYNGIYQSKEIFIEQIGFQLDSALAIALENFLPVITIYYLYKRENEYNKLFIHKIVFLLTCLYFICRLFINFKCYNSGKYFLSTLIGNSIIYWVLYSIICGKSIFNDDFDEMNIYSYFFTVVFVFCQYLCVKFVKEYKDNEIKNILFNYVKYPYYTMDCFIWISMMFIVFNKTIIIFTIIKIIYNIYLAFEQYIEEQGMVKISSKLENETSGYFYDNNNFQNNNQINKNNIKVIIPFIL